MSSRHAADWLEVVVQVKLRTVEEIEDWLIAAGALSVTLLDGIDDDELTHAVLEPVPGEVRLWDEVTVVGLFAQGSVFEDIQNALYLSAFASEGAVPAFRTRVLKDQVWERSWMDNFRPLQFGERLWVCPGGMDPGEPNALILRLDPGLAFGTGTHATTSQCLSWLATQPLTGEGLVNGGTVVDYGCGSGVLAIASVLLGAGTAYAVDIDEQALLSTRLNADKNAVSDKLVIGQPDILDGVEADVVVANILFQPLLDLADTMAKMLRCGGQLVLSGILAGQMDSLQLRYNADFEFAPPQSKDGWALMTATRR